MLSGSSRFSHISRFKASQSLSLIFRSFGFSWTSNCGLGNHAVAGETRHNRCTSSITSIPVGLPCFAILGKFIGNHQSLVTEASSDEEEVTDEFFNRILATKEISPDSNGETDAAYIYKLCKTGNLSAASRLLQTLRDKQIFLSTDAYNLLLGAASEKNNTDLSTQVFKDLLISHRCLSSSSYLNLVKSFIKTDDHDHLLRFVREVAELTYPRNVIIINRIIFSFAECGQTVKALLLFNQMKSLKCEPDLITYNSVLDILGRAGRVDEMLHEFSSMKEAGIIPDIISYNTLLNSLRKVGRLDICLVLMKEMGERGTYPDLLTYTSLIESFGRSGNVEESLRLFQEMKMRQIRPSKYIYRSLITNLRKMGKVELAITLTEEMNSSLSNLAGPKDFKRKNR